MDCRAPHTARPAAGASWFSSARLVVLLQGLIPLLWFLGWFLLDGMDKDIGGFGLEVESGIWFWLNELLWWIASRGWKENQWRKLEGLFNALNGALVAPYYTQYFIQTLVRWPSKLNCWIATCVYFAWSPDLARVGLLVVCGVVGWIITFTHAHYLRASMAGSVYLFLSFVQLSTRKEEDRGVRKLATLVYVFNYSWDRLRLKTRR
ncbi:hypothetical protein B0H16DRAFT_1454493 [Mycena metata]|uniref:Uncharacterized protein n=1 Tax=Mycena metata TaxID=1033252 RepID=A0AAD7JM31_9AGAR|nr:hypothetical protein B0H16DRAFT_1454493 [Mycena metata]